MLRSRSEKLVVMSLSPTATGIPAAVVRAAGHAR
jgi:hypothetical protein